MRNSKKIKKIISEISDTNHFKTALTHISYCNEHKLSVCYDNLEFLGDGLLGFHVGYYVYCAFPEFDEGKMSKLKQLMVQEYTLATLSEEIGLTQYLKLGTGEEKNGGLQKRSIQADIFESFLAALYLVKGDKAVVRFLNLTLFSWIQGKENIIWDFKTELQEYCQTYKNSVQYDLVEMKADGRQRNFVVLAKDKLQTFQERGIGKNRKAAEQDAAAKVLAKLGLVTKNSILSTSDSKKNTKPNSSSGDKIT